MLRFCLLGSGSSGNAILAASDSTKVLIDNGLSFKQLRLRAAAVGESLDDLAAVFITHEHIDHVKGLGTLARKLNVPVYMTEGTRDALPQGVGVLPRVEVFEAGEGIPLNGMSVASFSVSHDAADPVAYVVEYGGVKLGLAADLGHPSQLVQNRLAKSHALVLESNYCPEMLRNGKYPPAVQQRIRGRQGHLSNPDMSSLLAGLMHDRLQLVVLVHISEENNNHELALSLARQALRDHTAQLHVAWQDKPTPLFEIRP